MTPRPSHRRSPVILAGLLVMSMLVLAACAAGPNDVAQGAGEQAAGFWLGLWQGLISPITFLISLFSNSVGIYEVHNNGAWYDFGFMLGVAIIFSGPARLAGPRVGRSRRRRRSGTDAG
ncbi:MAG TPA: hypothetical protein VIP98_10040 [Microlunatus sp.]